MVNMQHQGRIFVRKKKETNAIAVNMFCSFFVKYIQARRRAEKKEEKERKNEVYIWLILLHKKHEYIEKTLIELHIAADFFANTYKKSKEKSEHMSYCQLLS